MARTHQHHTASESVTQRKVLVVVGPTASGKSTVSLLIAHELHGEIISADSRQVYKMLDVGTAKVTPQDLRTIQHYFVDELMPQEEMNAGLFGTRGREIIDHIFEGKKIPIVVGGSGLYIQGLIDGLFEGPGADEMLRKDLYERMHREGAAVLLEELRHVDPVAASTMLPSNTRRIARALEVYKLTGVPISKLHKKTLIAPRFTPLMVGLAWDRKVLYARINKRVDWMIESGLVEEVERLKTAGYTSSLKALQTVGYKEVFEYLDGRVTRSRMIELIKQNSRRYAKRQLTWFRADSRIRWFDVKSEDDFPSVAHHICEWYSHPAE